MRTAIEISDVVLAQTRKIARRERTTVGALVEQVLRQLIAQRRRAPAFRLRDASVDGNGLHPELASSSWDRLDELRYRERGG